LFSSKPKRHFGEVAAVAGTSFRANFRANKTRAAEFVIHPSYAVARADTLMSLTASAFRWQSASPALNNLLVRHRLAS
jgi:hypothetical protein